MNRLNVTFLSIVIALLFCGQNSFAHTLDSTAKTSATKPLETNSEADSVKSKAPVYSFVETMPSFKGGMTALSQFISEKIKYPPKALDKGIQGVIYVDFLVDTSGNIAQVACPNAEKKDPQLMDEAMRVVKLTDGRWIAGRNNGKAVKVKMRLPIVFTIEE